MTLALLWLQYYKPCEILMNFLLLKIFLSSGQTLPQLLAFLPLILKDCLEIGIYSAGRGGVFSLCLLDVIALPGRKSLRSKPHIVQNEILCQ
jgi:hypothetical protein